MGFKPIDGTMCEQGYRVKRIKGNFYVGYYVIFSTNSYNKNPKDEKHVDCSYTGNKIVSIKHDTLNIKI